MAITTGPPFGMERSESPSPLPELLLPQPATSRATVRASSTGKARRSTGSTGEPGAAAAGVSPSDAVLDQLDAVPVGVAYEAEPLAPLANRIGRLLGLHALGRE